MIAVALSLASVFQSPRAVPAPHEELEPATSVLTGQETRPYELALARALLPSPAGWHCHLLAIPSFGEPEWLVHVVWLPESEVRRDDRHVAHHPHIAFRRFRESLYGEFSRELDRQPAPEGRFRESEAELFERLAVPVDEWVAPISQRTAEALSDVWSGMLRRTRYAEPPMEGCYDGVTYHVAHEFRGAHLWSPEPETRAAAFVDLAERMCRLAEAPPVSRGAIELDLLTAAGKLKERVLRADREERERR